MADSYEGSNCRLFLSFLERSCSLRVSIATSVSDTTSGNALNVEVMTLRMAAPREQEKDVARDRRDARSSEEAPKTNDVAGTVSCVERTPSSHETRGLSDGHVDGVEASRGRHLQYQVKFKFV